LILSIQGNQSIVRSSCFIENKERRASERNSIALEAAGGRTLSFIDMPEIAFHGKGQLPAQRIRNSGRSGFRYYTGHPIFKFHGVMHFRPEKSTATEAGDGFETKFRGRGWSSAAAILDGLPMCNIRR
jgi:hypothetical protein